MRRWDRIEQEFLRHQVAFDRNQNLNLFMPNFANVLRLPEPAKAMLDLHDVIRSVTTLIELKAGEKIIEFVYEIGKEPIYINAASNRWNRL